MNESANYINDILTSKVVSWWDGFLSLLPNMAAGVAVLLVFYGLSKVARWLVSRVTRETDLPNSLQALFAGIAGISVFVIGIIVSLSVLGLQKTVTTALAGAGVIGLALGFAFRDVAANFVSGVFLIFRRPFTEGDLIEVTDQTGKVLGTNLRSTKLRTPDGETIYIPNTEVFQNNVTNYTEFGVRRIDIECGVAYDTDLAFAQQTAQEAVENIDIREQDRPVQVYFNSFGDSAISFTLRFWINFSDPGDYPKAQDTAILAIKQAFEREDIDMPFPIRTIKLDDENQVTTGS